MKIIKKMRMSPLAIILIACATAAFTGNPSGSNLRQSLRGHRGAILDTADAVFEMMRLQSYYSGVDHLSFDVSYNLVSWLGGMGTGRIDTFHFKVNGNKYYIKSDSLEQLQDSNYNIVLYKSLQQIILTRPDDFFNAIFQMDLMDPDFQQANVQNMTATDTSNLRKLSFQFYPQSVIKSLNIVYDTTAYKLKTIYGTMSQQSALPGDPVGTTPLITVTMNFLNYQNGMFTDTVFNMNRYFTKQQDSILFVPPYNTYQFVNSTLD